MRILGVDPGSLAVGFGVLEEQAAGCRVLRYGCLRISSKEAFPDRLKRIYDHISGIIELYRPEAFAIEDLFYAKNAKSALKMGHARGVAILAAVNHQIPTSEYSPKEVKQSITGNGAASKEQVQSMLQTLLNLDVLPEPLDASDALAVALCHIHRMKKSP